MGAAARPHRAPRFDARLLTYDVNHWPTHCPFGHHLGPGTGSMSWDMELHEHWLLCGGCGRKTRILLGVQDAKWESHSARGWVTVE